MQLNKSNGDDDDGSEEEEEEDGLDEEEQEEKRRKRETLQTMESLLAVEEAFCFSVLLLLCLTQNGCQCEW